MRDRRPPANLCQQVQDKLQHRLKEVVIGEDAQQNQRQRDGGQNPYGVLSRGHPSLACTPQAAAARCKLYGRAGLARPIAGSAVGSSSHCVFLSDRRPNSWADRLTVLWSSEDPQPAGYFGIAIRIGK